MACLSHNNHNCIVTRNGLLCYINGKEKEGLASRNIPFQSLMISESLTTVDLSFWCSSNSTLSSLSSSCSAKSSSEIWGGLCLRLRSPTLSYNTGQQNSWEKADECLHTFRLLGVFSLNGVSPSLSELVDFPPSPFPSTDFSEDLSVDPKQEISKLKRNR